MLPCLNRKLLGFDCLGCGIQRATVLFFNGDFVAAFHMYPGIYPLFLLLGYLLVNQFFSLKYSNYVIPILAIFTVSAIIVSYIIKMTT